METGHMTAKRGYYRETTASQRQLLFRIWKETDNVSTACQTARVSRGAFYYWKPRFEQDGYDGVKESKSHAPHHPKKTSQAVVERILAMKRVHLEWGKQRIADELRKENGWTPLVSAPTVGRLLGQHGLMPSSTPSTPPLAESPPLSEASTPVRHAEKPGQTANADLCFVPATHEILQGLPAVSGSSGVLKIGPPTSDAGERHWPGQVFENPDLSYEEAMEEYIEARTNDGSPSPSEPPSQSTEHERVTAQKREVKQQEEQLRIERRQVREQRNVEDKAYETVKAQHNAEQSEYQRLSRQERKAKKAAKAAADERWRAHKQQRREQKRRRQKENTIWRAQRQNIREQKEGLKAVVVWFAILVIVDNCTRHVYGLPLFLTGAHVTAVEVVAALRQSLPSELQYLITDRGVHFISTAMEKLKQEKGFVRVPIAPHRPQSNGIAERFVRTLKEWLLTKTWFTADELRTWLTQFLQEYNDRPHQGRELQGLSPNEYARRKQDEKCVQHHLN